MPGVHDEFDLQPSFFSPAEVFAGDGTIEFRSF